MLYGQETCKKNQAQQQQQQQNTLINIFVMCNAIWAR